MERLGRALATAMIGVALVAACSSAPAPGASSGPGTSPGPNVSPTVPSQTGASSEAPSGSLTVYSGRSEELVAPLLEEFETASGIDVEARYGDTAELAALILRRVMRAASRPTSSSRRTPAR